MPKIWFNHGLKETMPKLDFREPGITDDTEEVFVGGNTQNIQLAKQIDLDTTNEQLGNLPDLTTTDKSSIVKAINEHGMSLAQNTSKISGRRSITDWNNLVINKGQPNEDWKDVFQAARDFLNGSTLIQQLVFPAGIYQYSISPNWAMTDSQIVAEGEVRLRYTGTGNAVIIDGSTQPGSNVWNMKMGRFIVEAPSTAQDGVYVNAVHHSDISFKVVGAGSNYAGFHLLFSVTNTIHLTVSSNEEGWYQNAQPKYGLQLGKLSVGNTPSYNTFINPIIEHCIEGAYIDDSLGNIFIGGTMEGSADNGLWLTANAGLNKFYGTDLEANTTADVYCLGFQNEFHGIDSTKVLDFGSTAKDNKVFGGSYKHITLETGSTRNLLSGVSYNRELYDGTTGLLTDNGTKNRVSNPVDIKNNKIGIEGTVTFSGGWVTDATLNQPFKMSKDTDGFVNLSGAVSSPTSTDANSGSLLFTLPIGFRPLTGYVRFNVYSNGSTGVISIDSTTGEVRILSGSNTMLSFNGVRYQAA
jgi:hypothetical protein